MSPIASYRYNEERNLLIPLNGGLALPASVVIEPPPPPPPPPASWQSMVNSRDWNQVESWYETYTGFDGINPNDPTDEPLAIGDLVNVGGTVRSDYDGQVIEGVRGVYMQIRHNNVTVRRCLFEGGGTYGWRTEPTAGAPWTGTVTEFCTFDGGATPVDKAAAVVNNRSGISHTFRNCDIKGWSSGILALGGCRAEYCWTHNFYDASVSGAHVSSFNARGPYVELFRNYATEGGSPPISIYFSDSTSTSYHPRNNIQITENIINGSGNNLCTYLMMFAQPRDTPQGDQVLAEAHDIRVGGNYLGDMWRHGYTSQLGILDWGVRNNVRTDNIHFATGNPLS